MVTIWKIFPLVNLMTWSLFWFYVMMVHLRMFFITMVYSTDFQKDSIGLLGLRNWDSVELLENFWFSFCFVGAVVLLILVCIVGVS